MLGTRDDTFGKLLPAPVEFIIDKVLQTAQAGVHSAQQLYNSGQLPPDLRKEQATQYALDMIKLTGHEVTPELEQTIRNTAEAAVYVMKQKDPVPAPVVVPVPTLDPITVQPDITSMQSLGIPTTDELPPVVDPMDQRST